jgi:hypothetical protein
MTTKMVQLAAASFIALALVWAPVAHADDTDDQICGAYDLGVPAPDIVGRLGANDHRWNYWRAQQRVRDDIVGRECG